MSYQLIWQENRVLNLRIFGEHTIDDVRSSTNDIVAELKHREEPVLLICDLSDITKFPTQIKDIWLEAQALLQNEKIEHTLYIGINQPVLKFSASVISQLGKLRFSVAENHETAKPIIDKLKLTYSIVQQ